MGHPHAGSFILLQRFIPSIILFLQSDGELRFAGVGGVVEGFTRAVAFGGVEIEAMLDAVGESGETRLAVDVGAEFEVELAGVHESVSDVDFDLCGVNRSAGWVGDGEVGGAGADAAVEKRDGLGIGLLGCSVLCQGAPAEGKSKTEAKGQFSQAFLDHKV
jgi:hypothetical protein